MEFKYVLSGTGWATCNLEINRQKLEFTASYVTNCLDDFLVALMQINPDCVPSLELKKVSSCQWDGEPDGVVWTFELKKERVLSLKAEYFDDLSMKNKPEIWINTECLYDDFLKCVIREVDLLVKRQGIVGYRTDWDDCDFTLSTFLRLKHSIVSKEPFPVEEVIVDNDLETRSQLRYELELLLQDID
ncbi:hypothetical protein [Alkalihalobacterium elongatum]|uniref:hypothetical protein n=1 Tax=Alkalihalobacterium elongatum TaxID=2675466 RepID=UPI001C1F6750|nr:hypothetical protein [Alkalihalobacterium elongatum]